jgi:hypothetical protein
MKPEAYGLGFELSLAFLLNFHSSVQTEERNKKNCRRTNFTPNRTVWA